MSTLEIFLSSTKELMSGTTKYKNGEVTKSEFNNSIMLNLAFLLDTLNKQQIKFSSQEKEEEKYSDKEEQSLLYKLSIMMDPHRSPLSIGPKLIPLNYVINSQKAGTIIVMFLLMIYYTLV